MKFHAFDFIIIIISNIIFIIIVIIIFLSPSSTKPKAWKLVKWSGVCYVWMARCGKNCNFSELKVLRNAISFLLQYIISTILLLLFVL